MVVDFSVGKIKISIAKANDDEVVIEYNLDGHRIMDTVPVSDLMSFLRNMYESLKGFKVENKLDAEKMFDQETVEKLRGIGIRDFEYLSRGMQ